MNLDFIPVDTEVEELANRIKLNPTKKENKKKIYSPFGFLLILFFSALSFNLFSCQSGKNNTPYVVPSDPNIKTQELKEGITAVSQGFSKSTTQITKSASEGSIKTPDEVKPILNVYWMEILKQAGIQESLIVELNNKITFIAKIQDEIKDLKTFSEKETARAEREKERAEKAEAEAAKVLKDKFIWISVICFSGFVICGVMAVAGIGAGGVVSRLSFGGAVIFAVGLGLSIFLIQTISLIPWIVGGIVLVGGTVLAWRFYINNKAIKELVSTTEITKPFLTKEARRKLFGFQSVPGIIYNVQSSSTEDIVKSARTVVANADPAGPTDPTSLSVD